MTRTGMGPRRFVMRTRNQLLRNQATHSRNRFGGPAPASPSAPLALPAAPAPHTVVLQAPLAPPAIGLAPAPPTLPHCAAPCREGTKQRQAHTWESSDSDNGCEEGFCPRREVHYYYPKASSSSSTIFQPQRTPREQASLVRGPWSAGEERDGVPGFVGVGAIRWLGGEASTPEDGLASTRGDKMREGHQPLQGSSL